MDEPSSLTDSPRVVAVRLRHAGSVYDFDAGELALRAHDRVLVETDRGPTLGTVVAAPLRRDVRRRLRRVIEIAEARDLGHEDRQGQRTREMLHTALRLVRERELPIKLVKIEREGESGRTTLVYTSEDKFQHRDLARDLAHALGIHLDMRHIGARDEARVAGGVGVCGRELCCSSWLKTFDGVSVKMAKAQNLSLNFSKLAGQCGRLKCCLRYEYQTYVELKRALPKIGAEVESVKGNGIVVSQQLLQQTVRIRREDDEIVEVTLEDLVEPRPDA
jgi:cell fate regulator YaaT (PSP1 superfamily)